jgi:hypothetical protein
MTTTRDAPETSRASSSHFPQSIGGKDEPVTFVPGRARLATNPNLTASAVLTITVGVLSLALLGLMRPPFPQRYFGAINGLHAGTCWPQELAETIAACRRPRRIFESAWDRWSEWRCL